MLTIQQHQQKLKEKGVEVTFNHKGSGQHAVFTFSGVGMNTRYFSNYFKDQEKDFSFFHFTLTVHSFEHKEEIVALWLPFIDALVEKHEIKQFSLVAYSIGARLSFPLLNHQKLQQTILICPDGIVEPLIFKLATQTRTGGFLFHPIFHLVNLLLPSLVKTIKLTSKELFYLWKLYSVFKFPVKGGAEITLLLAKNDTIIANKKVCNLLLSRGMGDMKYIDANHFSILSFIKKNNAIKIK